MLWDVIYLDYNATTPVDRRVADRIYQTLTQDWGNASSFEHDRGTQAAAAIDQACAEVAQLLSLDRLSDRPQILFTSGATESLNLAIQGTVQHLERQGKRPRIAVTAIEHKAVLEPCQGLAQADRVDLTVLAVNEQGALDLPSIEACCQQGLDLLCVMAANNEIGVLNPMETLGAIAQRYQVPLLCDATQALGKVPLVPSHWGGSVLLAGSAHKLYGPQGCGVLILPRRYGLEPLLQGGGQQGGLRPGTLNLPGIVGFGEACRLRRLEMAEDEARVRSRRDHLQQQLQAQIPNLVVHGVTQPRLAGTLSISIPGIPNSALLARLRSDLACSSGSACTVGTPAPSHVLRALGLSPELLNGAVRLSLGKWTTMEEVETAGALLAETVQTLRTLLA
ncbi:MAG: cysteine desulfurase family protein [Prochlorothrix sp.]|nr:cysteine desulfurase family protein [Prochlorothrix sp.]